MSDEFKALETLAAEREGPLLRLAFDRPESGNAVDERMLDELHGVLRAVSGDPEIRVLVLSGTGPDFCLGGDRREFGEMASADGTGLPIRTVGIKARQVCEALSASTAVTVARLHGGVVGAGLGLAVFCDLRVGAETSRYRMPEVTLGLPPFWGGALARLISEAGTARVREFILTSDNFDAATAQRMAILHKVVPDAELDQAVTRWVKPLLRRSPEALRLTKATLNAYAASSRMGDMTLLESDLLASVIAGREHGRR